MTSDGRYLLRRPIAKGAMGVVYEARHQVTGRRVALKRVAHEHLGDDEFRLRFRREAQILGVAAHRSVVAILDAVVEGDDPYIVMELLEGRTLEGLLIGKPRLAVDDASQIALELCEALAAVHDAGVVHRDVKPANIVLQMDSRDRRSIKLIDFGIAAFEPRSLARAETVMRSGRGTEPGAILGTPEYMSPEQLRGQRADARSDLYALGVTLYEALTGTVPHAGSYAQVLVQVQSRRQPPSLRSLRPDVPEPFASVVERALRPDPRERFQTAREMAAAIEASLRVSGPARATNAAPQLASCAPTVMLSDVGSEQLAARLAAYRRRYARVPYVTPVLIHAGARVMECHSEDISEGGVLLLADQSCPNDAAVELELALPSTGTLVRITGVARWTRAGRAGKRVLGIEFDEVPANARNAIRALVARSHPAGPTLS
jgi:serine/threonine protein kinase